MPSTNGSRASGWMLQPLVLLVDNSGEHLLISEVVLVTESSPKHTQWHSRSCALVLYFLPLLIPPAVSLLRPGINSQINYLLPSVVSRSILGGTLAGECPWKAKP